MGWSIGFDEQWKRDVGYGVPAYCDHPNCDAEIDRGIAYVCGGELFGGEKGCGLHFCEKHLAGMYNRCVRCRNGGPTYTPKVDHPDWQQWKLKDESWAKWRKQNPKAVQAIRDAIAATTKEST